MMGKSHAASDNDVDMDKLWIKFLEEISFA
jgi:hypothetical protein